MSNPAVGFAAFLGGGVLLTYGLRNVGSAHASASTAPAATASSSTTHLSAAIDYKYNGKGPQTLGQDTPLTGSNAVNWAHAILATLHAPENSANVSSLLDWFQHEGGGGANNPMNTTLNTAGATGAINSDGVRNYATPADGVRATVSTLLGYPAIVKALRAGSGLAGSTDPDVASELHTWSGGGYSSL